MKKHKPHSNKLGTTVETSVYEFNDDLIIVCIAGKWLPLLQHKALRGKSLEVQRLLYSHKNPKVCIKIEKSRAEAVARSYANGSPMLHADPHISYLPVSYALYLGVLQGSKSDKEFLERMQENDHGET